MGGPYYSHRLLEKQITIVCILVSYHIVSCHEVVVFIGIDELLIDYCLPNLCRKF